MKNFIVIVALFFIMPACSNNGSIDTSGDNDDREIEFTTTGQFFAPVLVLKDGASARVLWTFADSTTSDSLAPSKDYGSPATRINRLKVTPWISLKRINVGYNAGDGGSDDIELVGNNYVIAIANLDLVKNHLIQLCTSLNPLTSLDLTDFVLLEKLECYACSNLDIVNLSNTPSLKRICFEVCRIGATSPHELNLSSNVNLEDLRAAGNLIQNLILPPEAPNWWHFCAGGNQFTINPDFNSYPHLRDIWVWNINLSGNITFTHNENLSSVWLENNPGITGLDFSSAGFTSSGGGRIQAYNCSMAGPDSFNIVGCTGIRSINVSGNALTYIDLSGQTQLSSLNAQNNELTANAVEHILGALDTTGLLNGSVNLTDNNYSYADLSADSLLYEINLQDKGWSVLLNE